MEALLVTSSNQKQTKCPLTVNCDLKKNEKKNIKLNKNKNTTYQNLWNMLK